MKVFRQEPLAVEVVPGWTPGCIGRVAELHGRWYHEHWGFGAYFESWVAEGLGQFFLRYDPARSGFWSVVAGGRIEGAIAIDGAKAPGGPALLRWFILNDALRGRGVGSRLLDTALGFCRARGFPVVSLWTFEGLDAARHLYEKCGFVLVEQHRGTTYGTEVNEQRFELNLTPR